MVSVADFRNTPLFLGEIRRRWGNLARILHKLSPSYQFEYLPSAVQLSSAVSYRIIFNYFTFLFRRWAL